MRMSTPARISIEACACRKLWNDLPGASRDHALVMLRGRSSSPSNVLNTKVVSAILPSPSRRRSSSCLTLWPRSRATAPSPKVMLRRPRVVFGGFSLRPARVSSTDRSTRRVPVPRSTSPHWRPRSSPRRMPAARAISTIGARVAWPVSLVRTSAICS